MLSRLSYLPRRSWIARLLTVMGLLLIAQSAVSVSAAFRVCRADPIVWLSNGQSVQITSEIGTDPADVRQITYTLRVPVGTTVTKIVYTGGALASKEVVFVVDDHPPHHYTTDTVITARGKNIPVTANTSMMNQLRGSVSGVNGDHLVMHFQLEQ